MEALLEVRGLSKRLGSFSLRDISFSLEPGCIMGVIGINGSGKTSLLKTILNLYEREEGEVLVAGRPMETQEEQAKEQMGIVMDEDFFNKELSVLENAKIFGSMYEGYQEEVFQELCRRFEIPVKTKVKKLSKGLRMRFQFAFALSHRARIYLMDEPADGLDPYFRRNLLNAMLEIVERGDRSVLFSTHMTEDLAKVADYILMMEDGRVAFCKDKEALRQDFRLVRGTKEEIEALPGRQVAGREHGLYHSEALLHLGEENAGLYQKYPIPKLSQVLYYLEKGGYQNVESDRR